MEAPTIIAVGLAVFNLVVTLVAVTWKLSRVEISLRDCINAERKDVDDDLKAMAHQIEAVREDIDRSLAAQDRRYQDTFTALRTKITEVELWSRDHFIHKDPFGEIVATLRVEMQRNRQELVDQIRELDKKLERLLNRT
jgi:hypothetical protein